MRRFACASFVVLCAVGLVVADEYTINISKIDGTTVIGTKKGAKKGEKGPEVKLMLPAGTKVFKGKFNKDTKTVDKGDEIPDGLASLKKSLEKAGEKGVNAFVVTDGDKITEIRITGKKGGKKKIN
jgi:hypothetical protein